MNNLEAYKMDGLGNDFIIFDNRKVKDLQFELLLFHRPTDKIT